MKDGILFPQAETGELRLISCCVSDYKQPQTRKLIQVYNIFSIANFNNIFCIMSLTSDRIGTAMAKQIFKMVPFLSLALVNTMLHNALHMV
jgi:hypothetical protein